MNSLFATEIRHLQYVVAHYQPPEPRQKPSGGMTPARVESLLRKKNEITKKVIAYLDKYGQSDTVKIADGIGQDRSALLKRMYVMEAEGLIAKKKVQKGFAWVMV